MKLQKNIRHSFRLTFEEEQTLQAKVKESA